MSRSTNDLRDTGDVQTNENEHKTHGELMESHNMSHQIDGEMTEPNSQ